MPGKLRFRKVRKELKSNRHCLNKHRFGLAILFAILLASFIPLPNSNSQEALETPETHNTTLTQTVHNNYVHSRAVSLPPESALIVPDREVLGGVPVYYKIPNNATALLMVLHGCHRFAASFFYSPEGASIVRKALKKRIAVVAITKENEMGYVLDSSFQIHRRHTRGTLHII